MRRSVVCAVAGVGMLLSALDVASSSSSMAATDFEVKVALSSYAALNHTRWPEQQFLENLDQMVVPPAVMQGAERIGICLVAAMLVLSVGAERSVVFGAAGVVVGYACMHLAPIFGEEMVALGDGVVRQSSAWVFVGMLARNVHHSEAVRGLLPWLEVKAKDEVPRLRRDSLSPTPSRSPSRTDSTFKSCFTKEAMAPVATSVTSPFLLMLAHPVSYGRLLS
mmetsp:Transcript_100916/g.290162  ORF Transcript_100916/g.290162 Transcript_100916/m.290162 type:complete len:222 (+) Transcript_100916:137-802(+)